MDARVVVMSRVKAAVLSGFFNRALRWSNELGECFGVIEINERESLVRQHQRRAAVDNVMDQHATVTESITKLLDFVRCFQGEVVIGQRDADAGVIAQFFYEVRDVEARADVEVGVVEFAKELKLFASGPVVEVEISRHARDCNSKWFRVLRSAKSYCAASLSSFFAARCRQ